MSDSSIAHIIGRRSIRNYLSTPVPADLLRQILQAGQYAPSGGNNQNSHFIVIQNKDTLTQLSQLAQSLFAKMEIYDGMYKSMAGTIKQAKKSDDYDFTYGAPVLVIVANKKEYGNAMADSALCIGNMLNAACMLGLGGCYINQLHWLNSDSTMGAFLYECGLLPEETVCGSLVLGNPAKPAGSPLARTGNKITFIE